MVSCCNRRLYKGNSYEICLPLADSGVTLVRFYTKGDIIIEKEPEISGDSMCFSFTAEELASLEDGVLRYEIVTDQETKDTNSPYVVVTPGDYSGSTLDDLLDDAFDSGYTAGQEDCSGSSCNLQSNKTVRLSEIPLIYSEDAGYYSISGNSFHVYPKEGKDGMERVQIFGNFRPDEAISHGFNIGYSDGYSQGTVDARGRMHSLGIGINDLTFQEYPETPSVPYKCFLFGSFSDSSGYSSVSANIEVTDLYSSAYTSGYTDGFQPGYDSGYMAGRNDQKSYIIPGNFSANGTYTNPDGWSPIHINVPQTGHTDQEMQDSWDSGYTSGYTAGQESCSGGSWEDGYDSGYTDGQASVDCTDYYNSGVTDGFGSGYTSGYTVGYEAGQADCSGYTQEDLDAAFASGYSAGLEACSGDTPSAATAITVSVPQDLNPGESGSTSVSTSPSGVPANLSYTSSDSAVATIDSTGTITAVGTGTTNICVTDSISQITACTQLTVYPPIIGNADVTATVQASAASQSVLISTVENLGSVDRMAIDGIEITPVSAYTFSDTNPHSLEVWYLSTTIPYGAYEGAEQMKSVVINDRMTVIGGNAFLGCTGITSAHIGSGMTSINNSAFQSCKSLTGIVVPDSVTGIGTYVFSECSGLTAASFGTGITVIPEGAMKNCNRLENMTINGAITSIGPQAFFRCFHMNNVVLPNGLTEIGREAFGICDSLTEVVIPDSVTNMGNGAFNSCYSLSSLTIGTGLTAIPYLAFYSCVTLTSISLPDSIISIGDSAFNGCESMTAATLGSGLTSIGWSAFEGCPYLRGIDIPATIDSIGRTAFKYDTALHINGITVRNPQPCLVFDGAFENTDDAPIYVPAESVETYKTSTGTNRNWSVYANRIQAIQ